LSLAIVPALTLTAFVRAHRLLSRSPIDGTCSATLERLSRPWVIGTMPPLVVRLSTSEPI
jgi:hypothetical protein